MNTKGWECPCCGCCYAPSVQKCFECGKTEVAADPTPRDGLKRWIPDSTTVTISPDNKLQIMQ